jgi:hypothetical protein
MAAKLIIRMTPDDRVHVSVEGLTEVDRPKPKGEKLCEKITKRIEQDLGAVETRNYPDDAQQAIRLDEEDALRLGGA